MFTGSHPIECLSSWWASRPDVAALYSDGRLHLVEAPEGTPLPYLTLLPVSEAEVARTTAFYYLETVLQLSAHAELPGQATALRDAVALAIGGIPISVSGSPAWYCLPGGQAGPMPAEGRGPEGADCWLAYFELSIPWPRPAPGQ